MVGASPNLSSLLAHARCQAIPRKPGRTITEMDNAVLWMLYSLGKGGSEIIGQRVAGLAALLRCSPHTVRDAVGRLTKAKLIIKRSDGFTLLEPTAINSFVVAGQQEEGEVGVKDEAGVVKIAEAGDQLGWIEALVAERFGSDSENDRDFLAGMMRKCCQQMLDGRVKSEESQEILAGSPRILS